MGIQTDNIQQYTTFKTIVYKNVRVKKEEAAWEVKIANMKLERDQFMKSFKADKDCSYDIEYAQAVSSAKTILETCKRSLQDLKTQNERVQEGINSGLIRPDVQKMIDTMEAAHKLEMEQIAESYTGEVSSHETNLESVKSEHGGKIDSLTDSLLTMKDHVDGMLNVVSN